MLALVCYAATLLMLVFAGILVSILLRRCRGFIRNITGQQAVDRLTGQSEMLIEALFAGWCDGSR